MAFTTKAFHFYYKRIGPTGSLLQYWHTASVNSIITTFNSYFVPISGGFLNFPDEYVDTHFDYSLINGYRPFVTTRDSVLNKTYKAFPWGCAAGDFLWNVLTPSWSFVLTAPNPIGIYTAGKTDWTATYTSRSFFRDNYPRGSLFGTSSYAVTSSWRAFDPNLFQSNPFFYPFTASGVLTTGPTYDITWPVINSKSTSSVDNQYFDQGGGVGITKTEISQSLVTGSLYATTNTTLALKLKTQALKSRRLYFPVLVSGSGTIGGTDYWFEKTTGKRATNVLLDNGGIYNVQFSLKRYIPNGYNPDLGSFMTAFIHNVIPQIPSSSNCVAGASGWYPPANNIVTIGNQYNGTSALSFYDIQTGYYIEKFNFNLIQYGYPAQLCLEVSGSLTDNTYFGIIVDDFKMCKIGVTTDPRFIKPTSIATTVVNTRNQEFMSAGGGNFETFDGG